LFSKFKSKLRTISASAEEQNLKCSIKGTTATKQQQVLHNLQSVFCFMLINVQLQLPAAQAQTKTSYSLFNKLA